MESMLHFWRVRRALQSKVVWRRNKKEQTNKKELKKIDRRKVCDV